MLPAHYLVKIFLKILQGGKCCGYHEGNDRCQRHTCQTTLFTIYPKSL